MSRVRTGAVGAAGMSRARRKTGLIGPPPVIPLQLTGGWCTMAMAGDDDDGRWRWTMGDGSGQMVKGILVGGDNI